MKKNTIENVRKEIEKRGCKLLSEEYLTQDHYLSIRFSCGHVDSRTFAKFKSGSNLCARCIGKKQFTYIEVREYFKENGYDLLSDEYINCKSRLSFKNSKGYLFESTFDRFKHNMIERGVPPNEFDICNPYTIQNIERFLKEEYSFLTLETGQKWKGNNKHLTFFDSGGYKYYLIFDAVMRYYAKSDAFPPYCDPANIYSIENISLWISKNKRPFYLVENQIYTGARGKLLFKCHNCHPDEVPFESDWISIQRGRGCGLCSSSQIGKYNNLKYKYPKIAKDWDYSLNYPVLPEEVSSHSASKYYWHCSDCGNSYFESISHRTGKETRGCHYCSESLGEKEVRKYLEEIKTGGIVLSFKKQVTFSECRNKAPLPFDFHISMNDKDFLCEYDGIQHYEEVKRFGGKSGLEKRQYHDSIKNEYCIKNNIPLIRIPYWKFDNIEQILEQTIFGNSKEFLAS
jgi:hypothetical protein